MLIMHKLVYVGSQSCCAKTFYGLGPLVIHGSSFCLCHYVALLYLVCKELCSTMWHYGLKNFICLSALFMRCLNGYVMNDILLCTLKWKYVVGTCLAHQPHDLLVFSEMSNSLSAHEIYYHQLSHE